MSLKELVRAEVPSITEIRRDLHRHPELGYQEKRTSEVVQRELAASGIAFKGGLAKGTGVLGYLPATHSPESAMTVALRADMDALPIVERTGLAYASETEGVMHACGHDGHTSILLGAARLLSRMPERSNNVVFIFQPAEEGGAGGREMVKDGALNGSLFGRPVDRAFGLHCYPGLPVGEIQTRVGPMMAAADMFDIIIHGSGGHAAMPHTTVDPIVIAAHVITALQSIAARNVSPLESIVVTVAQVQAGSAHNIIPETATLTGTLRALTDQTRELGIANIERIATKTAEALGGTAEFIFKPGYPVTANNAEMAQVVRSVGASELGAAAKQDDILPTMGAEDFSFYGLEVPSCFYWLGVLPNGQSTYPNLHAPEFNFNDDALENGMRMMCRLALERSS